MSVFYNGWSYTMVIFNLSATFLFLNIRTCPQMLLNVVVLGRETSIFLFFRMMQDIVHLFVLTVFFFQCYFSLCEIPTKFIFWKPVVIKLYLDLLCEVLLNLPDGQNKSVLLARWTLDLWWVRYYRTGISSYGCTLIRKDHCCISTSAGANSSCSWDHLSPGLQESPEPCIMLLRSSSQSHMCFFTSFLSRNDGPFLGKDV